MQSAGKRVPVSHDWFWFYFWLDEKLAQMFLTNHVAQQTQNQLLFDTQMKTTLTSILYKYDWTSVRCNFM